MNELHHTNVLLGEGDCQALAIQMLKENLDFDIRQNPDFLLVQEDTFGIEEAREFQKWAVSKPFKGAIKVSLLIVGSMTLEAQNALLKTLEEPKKGTYIFINLKSLGGILPTFLSRVMILPASINENAEDPVAQNFLKSSAEERFDILRSVSNAENKEDLKVLISNLEKAAHKDSNGYKNMQNILTAKRFAVGKSSSPKMLLEWLACVL